MSCTLCVGLPLVLLWMLVTGDHVIRPTFNPPLAGDAASPACANFSYGSWPNREFYSPGYPGNYPNKTECIHLLIAPRNYRIQLDFRDDFKIEWSTDCKYDYVEFRDGPFGYSPLIGRFCGMTHPPMMESSSRFMWVLFASDDYIEYKGFKAVYDFYKPLDAEVNASDSTEDPWVILPGEVCRIEVDISKHEGYINESNIPAATNSSPERPLDCTWAFHLPDTHRVTLRFEHLMTTLGSCEESFLEIYEETTAITDRRKKLCTSLPTFYKSDSNHVYIRLYADRSKIMPKFSAFFTIFTPGPCSPSLFECGDNTCINKSLECNGHDNCNYKWDEQYCGTSTIVIPTREPVILEYHTVVIGIVGGVIITVILLAIVITCIQKSREDSRQRHALHHEERQAMEIEMTNLLNRSPVHGRANAAPANGPLNHVGTTRPVPGLHGNHVSLGQPQLRAHTQALNGQQNGHAEGKPAPQPPSKPAEGDCGDFTDHNGGGPTYRRFLDVHGEGYYNGEDAGQNPGPHVPVPTVVTIEKQPPPGQKLTLKKGRDKSPGPGNRDRTPSPRPDIIQEEKFMYTDSQGRDRIGQPVPRGQAGQPERYINQDPRANTLTMSLPRRRLSDETVRSERSEVWKPMASADINKMPPYPEPHPGPPTGTRSDAPNQQGHPAHTLPPPRHGESQRYVEPQEYSDGRGYREPYAQGAAGPSHAYDGSHSRPGAPVPAPRQGQGHPPQGQGHPHYAAAAPQQSRVPEHGGPPPPDYMPEWDDGHQGAPDWRQEQIGFEPIAHEAMQASMPNPGAGGEPSGGSRAKVPPAPPQRHTPALTHQYSAPLPPTDDLESSPPTQRPAYSRTPPPKPRGTPSRAILSRGRSQEKPNIFYTRPNVNRSDRNTQPRQHHPV